MIELVDCFIRIAAKIFYGSKIERLPQKTGENVECSMYETPEDLRPRFIKMLARRCDLNDHICRMMMLINEHL